MANSGYDGISEIGRRRCVNGGGRREMTKKIDESASPSSTEGGWWKPSGQGWPEPRSGSIIGASQDSSNCGSLGGTWFYPATETSAESALDAQ